MLSDRTAAGIRAVDDDATWRAGGPDHGVETFARRTQKTRSIARLVDRNTMVFLDRFETILRGYRTGAMKYGCFVAVKDV